MSVFAVIRAQIKKVIGSTRPMELNEWSETHGHLSAESSADTGKWKSLPYQKPILNFISCGKYEMIVVKKSARVGFTKILNLAIGYYIEHKPSSILMVQPTIEDAEGYSKEEINPFIRDVEVLNALVSDAKAKDGTNTILHKLFPGGVLSIIGANSPRGFRRISRSRIFLDEVSGYPKSAGPEGSPVKLAIKRSEYYADRTIVAGSTPTIEGECEITRMFEETDQNYFFVPCPHCGEFQYLKFKNLKWPDGAPHLAYFECEANKCQIEHKDKFDMIEKGEFRPTAESKNPRVIGVHIWAAYSYSPNATWGRIAEEFLEAKRGGAESIKTFVNTVTGEAYAEAYAEKTNVRDYQGRVENFGINTMPENILLLTAGVDVQDNRVAVEIVGWGEGDESWVLSYQEIFGNPAQEHIWKQLDNVLLTPVTHPKYGPIRIQAVAVDTGGHHTHEVYAYCRDRKSLGFIAIKGASQRNKPAIGKPTNQDINLRGKTLKKGVQLYSIGTDTIKNAVYSRMKILEAGAKYVHFSFELTDDFFQGLVSERKVTRFSRGKLITEWKKNNSHARNESWDCLVYNFAAKEHFLTKFPKNAPYSAMKKILDSKIPKTPTKIESEQKQVPEPKTVKQPARRPKGGGGFANGW